MSSEVYFNKVAHQWDEMRKEFFSDELREKAIARAKVKAGELAADIGAGTGYLTDALIKRDVGVIAIDESEEMVRIIRQKCPECVMVRKGEAEQLPISDNVIDYAFANMYLHHVANPKEAIKEMVRILKPQGRLIITDLDAHNHEFLRTEQNDRWLGFERRDIQQWFEEAGLENVTVECTSENCCADATNCDDSAEISIFIAYGEKKKPTC